MGLVLCCVSLVVAVWFGVVLLSSRCCMCFVDLWWFAMLLFVWVWSNVSCFLFVCLCCVILCFVFALVAVCELFCVLLLGGFGLWCFCWVVNLICLCTCVYLLVCVDVGLQGICDFGFCCYFCLDWLMYFDRSVFPRSCFV